MCFYSNMSSVSSSYFFHFLFFLTWNHDRMTVVHEKNELLNMSLFLYILEKHENKQYEYKSTSVFATLFFDIKDFVKVKRRNINIYIKFQAEKKGNIE